MQPDFLISSDVLPPGVHLAVLQTGRIETSGTWLQADELARIERLKSEALRAERRAGLAARRQAISQLTGAEPDAVRMSHTDEGAPLLSHPPGWSVSFSDIKGYSAVAIAQGARALGVDIVRPEARDWRAMLAMISDAEEAAAFQARWGDDAPGRTAFHRMWTIKEAVLKASGRGMRAGAKHVGVDMAWLACGGVFRLEAFGLALQGVCDGSDDLIAALVAGPDQR